MQPSQARAFAPGRQRTQEGWVVYPPDARYRKEHYIPEAMAHPAKMVCYLLEDIVDWVSKPGETILDPMSGVGTVLLAMLRPDGARKVVAIEDSSLFYMYQQMSLDLPVWAGVRDLATLLQGPCQDYLPVPCDHVVFSPPYSNVFAFKAKAESTQQLLGKSYIHDAATGDTVMDDYLGESPKNVGRMTPFFYNQAMSQIYGLLLQSVRPGGTMTVVIQDLMEKGKRNELTTWVLRTCVRQGWELRDWFDRHSRGSGMKTLMKSKGYKVIENESIIVLEKPR